MGRCLSCNERIKTGEDIILEGQYPGILHRLSSTWWFGLESFGRVYHRSCYVEMLHPKASQPETIVKEGKIKKQCPQCGNEFPKDFEFCPYCGGFEH